MGLHKFYNLCCFSNIKWKSSSSPTSGWHKLWWIGIWLRIDTTCTFFAIAFRFLSAHVIGTSISCRSNVIFTLLDTIKLHSISVIIKKSFIRMTVWFSTVIKQHHKTTSHNIRIVIEVYEKEMSRKTNLAIAKEPRSEAETVINRGTKPTCGWRR